MKEKSYSKPNELKSKTLKRLFFFILFYFSLPHAIPQIGNHPLDTLLTHDFRADSIKSSLYFNKGVESTNNGDNQSALDNYQKSLYIRRKIYDVNHIFIGFALTRAGVEYKELGRLNEAIESYLEVERIFIANEGINTTRLGTPYSNLGNVYKQKGNYIDAIKYHRQAINHFSFGDTIVYHDRIIDSKYNLAEMLYQTKQYNESLEIALSCYKNSKYHQKASFLNLLGNIYVDLKDTDKAKRYLELSVKELRDNASDSQDTLNLADLSINYAQFLIETDDFEEAESNLEMARLLIRDYIYGRDVSSLYFTYGNYYAKKPFGVNSLDDFKKAKTHNLETALGYYQKAIIALSGNFTDKNPSANPAAAQCKFESQILQILQRKAETFYELAQIYSENNPQKLTNLENSLSASQLASDLLNNLRTGTVSEESKIVMTQLQNSSFLFTVKIAYELFRLSKLDKYFEIAFQNAERNKAASLLDNLTDENARQGSFLPDSLVKKEENINDQISIINQKLFEENQALNPDSVKIKKYGEQLFQLAHDKNDLVRFLEINYSDYYQLKYSDDKVTLPGIYKKLTKNEVIIEYVFDKTPNNGATGNFYILLISKNDFEFKKIPVDSIFITDIDKVYQFLSASDFINIPFQKYNEYLVSANNLYKALVMPVENEILNRSVTIVPDGKLSYIPFDALLSALPKTVEKLDFKNLDYLIKKYLFNYSYSANLYFGKYSNKKQASKKLLAFAPEYGANNLAGSDEFNRLAPLAGIFEEVKSIAKYIRSQLFIGDSATESNFKNNYLDYDILHLAMHAIINDSLPMFSKLAFSPESDTAKLEDGWLTTSEIYNMKLNARLSVLSACNTGSGALLEGEGVISLARGFFYAGCPSIVMTLWEVDDRSGAEIMGEFYKLLSAGKKKHEALRLAKLKHISKSNPVTAHPHVWLSYVSIGSTDALYSGKDFYLFIIILAILIAVVIDQLYKKKKARKNQA